MTDVARATPTAAHDARGGDDDLGGLTDIAASEWPMDAWYAAAYDAEVGRRLTSFTVAGLPVVLYRTLDGTPVALADACWHRLVPLSMGRLCGDEVECGYHGIRYDAEGRCTHMPAQRTINPSAGVRAFPTVERHRFIWVWPGDPAKADPELVPDMHWNDDPLWAADGKVIEVDAGYQLILDNLMDLTHEEFIHTSSIGNDDLSTAEFDTVHDKAGRRVTVTRWMRGIEPPPLWRHLLKIKFPEYHGPVDRWQIIHYQAPATICIDVGVAIAGTGAPEGDRSQGVNGYVLNTMCPTGPKTARYLWAIARNFAIDKQRVTTELREGVGNVFFEDETMLNAQQRAIDDNPGYDFYNINIDAGGMWARRLIKDMIAEEKNPDVSAGGLT
ncbi:aromatic ring-hydroxylating dioxygenase subunit alpha [Nocardioides zeae]|uniref:Phenylpropionate dioxygenase-like ring-hydroxylating dioxygenase large terminal subunit n=1 Tax=Nocardioides zeae TaxID=1457234 RepID=A0AAJ1U7K7_9ACTN|nr:aromatic ring-hydroxylating dioxygenase subunit alpha [Nocardioides zeae]MDQ1105632.1 phenylpropionate dioxygenase-like ring-hydroxylating dioxygenase large terminal subunit [Nocardioides zeae]